MKFSNPWLAVAALCLLALSAQAQTPAPPRDDTQFWHETQFIKSLTKNKDLIIVGVVRVGRDLRRPVDERIGAGLAFKLNKYLTLPPTYFYVDQQPFDGARIREHRLILNATGKVTLCKFTFTDRNLYERRVRHVTRDFSVYRNRLQVDYPVQIGSLKFKPFLADEVWYSTQSNSTGEFGWVRNRISAGIIKQFADRFNAEFFYLRQDDGIARPGNVHALGTLFRVYFK
jgi:hypothetical protein